MILHKIELLPLGINKYGNIVDCCSHGLWAIVYRYYWCNRHTHRQTLTPITICSVWFALVRCMHVIHVKYIGSIHTHILYNFAYLRGHVHAHVGSQMTCSGSRLTHHAACWPKFHFQMYVLFLLKVNYFGCCFIQIASMRNHLVENVCRNVRMKQVAKKKIKSIGPYLFAFG